VRKIIGKVKQEIAYYRALFAHPQTPRISRLLLGGAIAYLVSPIDIIPDFIPILGQLDDLLIVPSMVYAALAFIPASVKTECRARTAYQASAVGARKIAEPCQQMKKDKIIKCSLLSLCLLFVLAGCATVPRGFPPIEGITNFDRVNDDLYRGAQPNNYGIKSLKRLGIKTIVNLRMANDVWLAEEAEARAAGITYTNVPMNGLSRPTNEQVTKVLSIIATFPSPVFIHCQHGCDRTGTIIACYRIKHDKWSSASALWEAEQYGMSRWEFGMRDYVADFAKNMSRNKELGGSASEHQGQE